MQQIIEKSDSTIKSLNLSAPLQQQKSLNIGRQIIDTSELHALTSRVKKDSAKRQQAQTSQITRKKETSKITQTRTIQAQPRIRREAPADTLQIIEPRTIVAIPEIPVRTEMMLPEKQMLRKNSDWILVIFILSLVIIASVRIIFNPYLKQLFNATINLPTATRLFRERAFNLLHAAFRLDFLFYLILALFAYQSTQESGISFGAIRPFPAYLICLGTVIGYFLSKRFIYLIISVVNESQTETSEYLFNINIYNRVLGIILFPITLSIAFIPLHNVKLLFITGLIIIAAFYLLSLVRGSKILMKKHFSISYLILYLCTLEFLPLLVIYKIVSG